MHLDVVEGLALAEVVVVGGGEEARAVAPHDGLQEPIVYVERQHLPPVHRRRRGLRLARRRQDLGGGGGSGSGGGGGRRSGIGREEVVADEIGRYWKERISQPLIISLAKGIEASLDPVPRIITPTQMISNATGVPLENILYLGGPNIASEIYNKEYANARICGADKWRKHLANFLRQPHFIVWDNSDLITHEVMGGLKNVYAIGAGMVAALTNESATSKSVYFSLCTSEMIYITHLLAPEPEKLAGPLLADTYVTLLKGRNAWYGQKLAKGELTLEMGDSIKGKGTIQGVSAVNAFYELLSQGSLSVMHPETKKAVAPVELCPILKTLYKILIKRELTTNSILQAIRDESMYDPRERIEMAQRQSLYRPSLLGLPKADAKA